MLNDDVGKEMKLERLASAAWGRRMPQGNFGKMILSSKFSACKEPMSEEIFGKP